MKISFLGAAQNVTGSKHLLETNGFKILLDCGLYQGKRSVAKELNSNLPFDAKEIDAVILSHGHADHCGLLPTLIKNGYQGKIYCTNATADVAKFILEDSAKIQEQDAIYYNENLPIGADPIHPMYNSEDVAATVTHFSPVPYFRIKPEWTVLNENIRFKFYDAGHILGSAVTYLEIKEDGLTKTLAFSGDLGHPGVPILHDPEYIKEPVDSLILECTYGATEHSTITDAEKEIKEIVNWAVHHKSKIIVPAFALGRVQELVYILHKLTDAKEIPRIPIYVDSPLAGNLSDVFLKHSEDFNDQVKKDFTNSNELPLVFRNLIYTQSVEESKALNTLPGPFMIISASGMAEGGRILHHLKNNLSDPNAIVLLTGYQAENTLGRKIEEHYSTVKIFDRYYDVHAKILSLDSLSAHADQTDLSNYIEHCKGLKKVFLVHTEEPQASMFKDFAKKKFPNIDIEIPSLGENFLL
jgi:metallo-beta-lactamase family protein